MEQMRKEGYRFVIHVNTSRYPELHPNPYSVSVYKEDDSRHGLLVAQGASPTLEGALHAADKDLKKYRG